MHDSADLQVHQCWKSTTLHYEQANDKQLRAGDAIPEDATYIPETLHVDV
jgi:hypothetical protein